MLHVVLHIAMQMHLALLHIGVIPLVVPPFPPQ